MEYLNDVNKRYKRPHVLEVGQDTEVTMFEGKSKNGKDFKMFKQVCWLHLSQDQYPSKVEILVDSDNNKDTMTIGFYSIQNALAAGDYNSIAVNRDISFSKLGKTDDGTNADGKDK